MDLQKRTDEILRQRIMMGAGEGGDYVYRVKRNKGERLVKTKAAAKRVVKRKPAVKKAVVKRKPAVKKAKKGGVRLGGCEACGCTCHQGGEYSMFDGGVWTAESAAKAKKTRQTKKQLRECEKIVMDNKKKVIKRVATKKAPSDWVRFLKAYMNHQGISYKEAMQEGGPKFQALKSNPQGLKQFISSNQ